MRRTIAFRTTAFDTTPLIAEVSNYEMFRDSDPYIDEGSICDFPEKKTVEYLLGNYFSKDLLISELASVSTTPHLDFSPFAEISEPVLEYEDRKKIGDVDLLLIPKNRPDVSIAVEFKRVKVKCYSKDDESVNKVEEIRRKGIKQAKILADIGFSQVYLGIMLQYDGRKMRNEHIFFRYSDGPASNDVYDLIYTEKIDPRVGIFYLRLNQPTGRNFSKQGSIGIFIDRVAARQKQSFALTNRLKELHDSKIATP